MGWCVGWLGRRPAGWQARNPDLRMCVHTCMCRPKSGSGLVRRSPTAPALLLALWPPCRVGDASRLDELAPLAGVVSVFGLQQMPQPAAVLANWTRALAPGGAG